MTVNLSKNSESMLSAWNEIVNDKCNTDWALFGYEKQSNDLKLVSTGEDGLEEMADEFNSGKIMYALCRVIDPKTSLPKFVFINWQGEGAPTIRKGNCAYHVQDIKNFFTGSLITINARADDEVEPERIMEKVSKSTGSFYSFKERSTPEESPKPVFSVYKKVRPTSEINPEERDKFWEQQEMEEKNRISEEQKKLSELRKNQEKERIERECKETAARDEVVKERSRSISEMRKAELVLTEKEKFARGDKEKWNQQLVDDVKDDAVRRNRSESLKQERNMEAQQLIGKRTVDARAVFEQNTNAGQMVTRKNSRSTSESAQSPEPVQEQSMVEETVKCDNNQENISANSPSLSSNQDSNENFSYTKNLLENDPPKQESDNEDDANWDEPPLEDPPKFSSPLDLIQNELQSDTQIITSNPVESTQESTRITARALYDYQAVDDTEISFDPEDIITNIDMIDEGWWQGFGPDGAFGLFPANYVEVIKSTP